MSDARACPICGNENWDGRCCLSCGYVHPVEQADTVKVRYVTKDGEVLYTGFSPKNSYTFERWFADRIEHEGGFFPYEGGRINCNVLVRIEVVEE